MEKAKIFTDGNTRILMVTLPDDFCPDCSELNVYQTDSSLRIVPPKKSTLKDFFEVMSGFTEDVADTITEARKNDFQAEREEL